MVVLLLSIILIPLIPYTVAAVKEGISNPNPGAQFWRDVRQRDKAVEGSTQVKGVDTGILIAKEGEEWRLFRMQQFIPTSAIFYGIILALFALYFMVRGKVEIEGGRSGNMVPRISKYERYVHWFTAIIFVLLTVTGLAILYGRYVLIPLLGPEGFSVTANVSKAIHNYIGPLFLIGVVLMFFNFVRDSWFDLKVDTKWVLTGGGYFGSGHPSAGKFNAGQKAWFWVAILGGLVLVGSGLVLDFANYGQGRTMMQDAHVIHSISSVIVIGFFLVHLYTGTVGVEGSLESVVSGNVDENFIKQHHDLWYEEIKGKNAASNKQAP